jgi:UDP-N-acetylmuramoylalanine--D-glutamate ligase
MKGLRIAVLGAGRSGIAVSRAAKERGAEPTLYDSKDGPDLESARTQLDQDNVEVVGGREQPFTSAEADILVTSPGVDSRSPILRESEKNGVEVIGEVEFAYRIAQGSIIAITGTNGKSTTTAMTWHCLEELGLNPVLCGNIYGSGYVEIPLTEAAAIYPGRPLVAEVSSFQLEWIKEFRPKCAAITNIAPDHLNRYDHFDDYACAKRNIFRNMGEGDVYVSHRGPRTEPPSDARFKTIYTKVESRALVLPAFEIATADLPFSESHNLQNAAMAATLAYEYAESGKVPDESTVAQMAAKITAGLQSFRGLAHRMERVGERDGVVLVNNSMCTNPDALLASSRSVPTAQHLLVGGLTKDLDFGPFAEYLKGSPHRVYLYGADASKINARLGGGLSVFRTMGEAFAAATMAVKRGETIMLAPGCASMDQYKDFRARGDDFRTLAKEWLQHDKVPSH